jgi:asparagine synthase (glutamine-hydrolysing)
MCGIAGYVINSKHNYSKDKLLEKMLENIAHRGTDNRGVYFNSKEFYEVGLGHNRLSIIDTSNRSNQPFLFDNFCIVFNGEIYNYQELWVILKNNGYEINTTSDTEVIIKLFHLYKEKAFSYLNGMFSIVIYDSFGDKLYLIRDRLGVKPLIYYNDDEHIYFSSEIKSLYKGIPTNKEIKIKNEFVNSYFKYGYINSFDSIFSNVRKVKNGQIVTVDLNTFCIKEDYFWELDKIKNNKVKTLDSAISDLKIIVDSSVKYRLVSDVGFGIFLSSGIDSNLVLNVLLTTNPIEVNSYTYTSDDTKINEIVPEYNKPVKQTYVQISDDQLWNDFKKLCSQYDEPFADPATVGLYGLSLKARELNKVILVGDGGDELLGGYQTYEQIYYYTRPSIIMSLIRNIYKPFSFIFNWIFKKYPLIKFANKIYLYHSILSNSNLFDVVSQLENRFVPAIKKLTNNEFNDCVQEAFHKNDLISFLNHKIKTELIHQLNYKTDIAGMLNTIEIREPLLDYRLFEFMQRISEKMIFDKSKSIRDKYLYKKILESYNNNLGGLKKKGFINNFDNVFKKNILEIDKLIYNHKSDLIDIEYASYIWNKYKNNSIDFVIVFRLVSFILWEKNLINRI